MERDRAATEIGGGEASSEDDRSRRIRTFATPVPRQSAASSATESVASAPPDAAFAGDDTRLVLDELSNAATPRRCERQPWMGTTCQASLTWGFGNGDCVTVKSINQRRSDAYSIRILYS